MSDSTPGNEAPSTAPADEQAMWDQRYADSEQVWSGEPNGALVAETQGMPPGTVLDVGCGEGADAVWLAHQGWDVTALDVSSVALDRARRAAAAAAVTVRWLHSGLLAAPLPASGFDLVSAQYPALARTPGNDAERALLAAVAPGGTLLFVHHDVFGTQHDLDHHGDDPQHSAARGFDPQDFIGVADVAALLGAEWQIEFHEVRSREVRGGAGAHHSADLVLKARRLP